jgi:hypothetical protein
VMEYGIGQKRSPINVELVVGDRILVRLTTKVGLIKLY